MIHYFYGEDTYRARREIDKLAEEKKARVRWLDRTDFEEAGAGELLGKGATRGLFGQELLVVRDIADMPASLQGDILIAVEQGAASCVLWDRGKPDKRLAVYKKLREKGREFELMSPGAAAAWLKVQAEERGGQIDEAAARELVERVGTDGWGLVAELEKLLVMRERITVSDVLAAVPEAPIAEVFSMLDALTRGDKRSAIRSIEILLDEGNSEFYILSMLAYQFRTLLAVRRGIDKNQMQAVIAKENRMKPYSVQKNYAHAQRFPVGFLRGALTRILAADFSIKQGKVDQRTGLMMLVLNLVKGK
ncbi:MAG: DNA polymerase III subunit delta [bacterium]